MGESWTGDKPFVIQGMKLHDASVYLANTDDQARDVPEALDRRCALGSRAVAPVGGPIRYSDLSDDERTYYLTWLSNDRSAIDAPISVPFLYLFGIERRVLSHASRLDTARTELLGLRREVSRLQRIYGHDDPFDDAAENLMKLLSMLTDDEIPMELRPEPRIEDHLMNDSDWKVLRTRVELARLAAIGTEIPATLAYNWHVDICEADGFEVTYSVEFRDQFVEAYSAAFGAGLIVRPRRQANIRFAYTPSNPHLSPVIGEVLMQDIFRTSSALRDLRTIAPPAPAEPLETLAPSPDPVDGGLEEPDLRPGLSGLIAELFEHRQRVRVGVATFLDGWRRRNPDAPATLTDSGQIAQLLDDLRIGMTPDARFDLGLEPDSEIILFDLRNSNASPSPMYQAAALIVALAASVAHADGIVAMQERQLLKANVMSAFGLIDDEAVRLEALSDWLLRSEGAEAALTIIGDQARSHVTNPRAIGQFLVQMARADGRIVPEEELLLRRMFALLGLDASPGFDDPDALVRREAPSEPAMPSSPRELAVGLWA